MAKTGEAADFTAQTWTKMQEALAKEEEAQKGNTEAQFLAYSELIETITALEKAEGIVLENGLYTAAGKIGETGLVSGASVLVREGSVDLRLEANGIQSLQYYDLDKKTYVDEEATQTPVNQAVEAIDQAIQGLETVGAIKTDLKAALDAAKACLMDADRYTAAALEALERLYDEAKTVYEDPDASQEEVDAQVRILTYAVENLKRWRKPR